MRLRKFQLVRPVATGDPRFLPSVTFLPAELLERVSEDLGRAMRADVRVSHPGVHVSESIVLGAVLLQGVADLMHDGRRPHARRVQVAIRSYLALYGSGVRHAG
jgi:hypothetical protein